MLRIIVALASVLALPAAAQTFEASNGERFRVVETHDGRGTSNPFVRAGVVTDDGDYFALLFDCNGHYLVVDPAGRETPWRSAPPRSVLAQVGRSVCR